MVIPTLRAPEPERDELRRTIAGWGLAHVVFSTRREAAMTAHAHATASGLPRQTETLRKTGAGYRSADGRFRVERDSIDGGWFVVDTHSTATPQLPWYAASLTNARGHLAAMRAEDEDADVAS